MTTRVRRGQQWAKGVSAALALACGCAGEPDLRPDVVLIVLDTFRADHLGVLGAGPGRTPVLDRLANDGVLYERCISQAPLTLPSISTLVSSQWPNVHRVRDNYDQRLSDRAVTMSEVLGDAGYATGAFVSALPLRAETGVAQGFDTYDDDFSEPFPFYREKFKPLAERWTGSERRGDNTVARAIRWLDAGADDPHFLFVHLFDPHSPYDAPEPYASAHESPYAAEIAFTDDLVGRVVEAVSARAQRSGRRPPIVAIVADHGEGLGEHEEWAHGFFLYDATVHVPLILWSPPALEPRRVSSIARVIDVAPTVLGLVDGATPPAEWAGVDLLRSDPPDVAYTETWFPREEYGWSELDAVVVPGWKWIRAPRSELYDLVHDPGELENLQTERPTRATAMAALRDSVVAAAIERARRFDVDGLVDDLTPEARVQEWLSNLGYIGSGGGDVEGPRPDPKDMVPEWNRSRDARTHASRAERFHADGHIGLALQAYRASLDAERTPEVLSAYARCLVDAGDEDEAARAVDEALVEAPNHLPALLVAAEIAGRRGAWEVAERHLRRATLVDSTSVDAWRARATSERALGRHDDAAKSWARVLADGESGISDRRRAAESLREAGRTNEALAVYRDLVGEHADPIDLWHLGRLELAAGHVERAREAWLTSRRALRRGAMRDSIDRALDALPGPR